MDVDKILKKIQVNYHFGSYITHTDGFEIPLEISACSKFYYVTEGEYELTIDGKAYKASRGSLFFIPAGISHSRRHIGNCKIITQYWFHFDFISLTKSNLFEELKLPYVLQIGIKRDIIRLFNIIMKLSKSKSLGLRLKLTAAILNLLSYFIEKSSRNMYSAKKNIVSDECDIMYKVTQYIKENIDRQITGLELSEIACMQNNYFIRYFKKKTGMTPHKFVLHTKINTAVGFLENTNISIGNVMEKIGFYDMSHFSKTFKKQLGVSPMEYINKFSNTKNKSNGIEKKLYSDRKKSYAEPKTN